MIPGFSSKRRFSDLSEQEVLALTISAEEDDGERRVTGQTPPTVPGVSTA